MNRLLQLNKNILLFILFCVSLVFIFKIIFNNSLDNAIDEVTKSKKSPNFDIINPSFTINNDDEKIIIKAKRGNFLTKEKILLENNVIFQSPRFTLSTSSVIYNQQDQTALSTHNSKFNSNGTTIISEGFEITNNGEIIFFNGKTNLILKNK